MNSRQSQGKITAIYCRLSRDDDLAAVVRRIFRMVIDGKGVYQIADILSEEKVLCPSAYLSLGEISYADFTARTCCVV